MVDYDKLNYAHDLTEKYYEQTKTMTWIKIMISSVSDLIGYQWTALHDCLLKCEDIDELIAELEKQTRAKPKYADGSLVWCVWQGDIHEFTVAGIEWDKTYLDYVYINPILTDKSSWLESQLYSQRSSLIDAQVEYWQAQICPEFEGKVEGFTPETVKVRGVERAVTEFDSCTHERDESKDRVYPCKHCKEFF